MKKCAHAWKQFQDDTQLYCDLKNDKVCEPKNCGIYAKSEAKQK